MIKPRIEPKTVDHLREAVIEAATAQNITAYAISKQLDGSPTPEAVKRFLTRRCGLGTKHVSRICTVLGLSLTPYI